jgi:hypothetical protein
MPDGQRQKSLNRFGRKLGVAHGVLDVLVTEIGLQRVCVVASIGERITTRMPQHVRVDAPQF